jgi:hypothetical protein
MTQAVETLEAPAAVREALRRLCADLARAAGPGLVGLILYGGLARGRFYLGRSDINLVVLLREVSAAMLTAVAPTLNAAWRSIRVEPFILTPAEIPRVAAAFPIKLLDIKDYHVVLHGEDPFATLQVPRAFIRLRVEQELRNLGLRLRRRFLGRTGNPAALAEALSAAARPLAVQLASLLRLAEKEVPAVDRTAAILDLAAVTFGLDRAALAELAGLRAGAQPTGDAAGLYTRVLQAIARAADQAADMKEPAS